MWQPTCSSRFHLVGNRMAARTFRKKKQQQSRVFFDVIFDVYTHVDNRERARASDWKQRRRISWEEKHENFIAAVRKREMLAASKVKMSGSEKIKANMNTGNKIFGKHIPVRQLFHKNILYLFCKVWCFSRTKRRCSRAKKRQRKTKMRAARANLFFC